jgi:site-specific DNA-methyltransferase (adenine-specific)
MAATMTTMKTSLTTNDTRDADLLRWRWACAADWIEVRDARSLVFVCDAFEAMRLMPDGVVDLIITDPPYASLDKYRDSKARIRKYEREKAAGLLTGTRIPRLRDWFPVMPNERFPELLAELYRVLAPDSHCYIFCDDETSDVIRAAVEAMAKERGKDSFTWWKRIVWDKLHRGQGYHYPNQHEFVVFLEKGKRKLNTHSHASVLACKRVSKGTLGGRMPGPTEKPVSLCAKLIENSSKPKDLVFDPFCGRGATGVAALYADREFLGFDVQRKAVRISRARLRDVEMVV